MVMHNIISGLTLARRFYSYRVAPSLQTPNSCPIPESAQSQPLINHLEFLTYDTYKVHDNGFVHLFSCMPDLTPPGTLPQDAIARSARVSTLLGPQSLKDDSALITRLLDDYHTSPVETLKFGFIIRTTLETSLQILRHRMANYNQKSQRYSEILSELDPQNICPIVGRRLEFMRRTKTPGAIRLQGSELNKQGSTDLRYTEAWNELVEVSDKINVDPHPLLHKLERYYHNGIPQTLDPILTKIVAGVPNANTYFETKFRVFAKFYMIRKLFEQAEKLSQKQFEIYHHLVSLGTARETARSYLPQATYTELQMIMDMNNLLKFFFLRCNRQEAQREIADVADAMRQLIRPLAPTVMEHFESSVASVTLTGNELAFLTRKNTKNLTKRQKTQLQNKLNRLQEDYGIELGIPNS